MEVRQSPDTVIIGHRELMEILRAAVRERTGREPEYIMRADVVPLATIRHQTADRVDLVLVLQPKKE